MKGHNYGYCHKCGRFHENPRGMLGKKNPNAYFKDGHIGWNKGLTKEIDDRIAQYAEKIRICRERARQIGKKYPKVSEAKKGSIPWNKGLPGVKPSIETTIKRSESMKKVYENNPELRVLRSIQSKSGWLNEELAEKRFSALKVKPNKSELYLDGILQNYSFGRYKYVGDGKTFIAGKCPDWVDFKNRRIIELFGTYWHKPEDEQERKEHFARYNYRTLVIWSCDLREDKVLQLVKEFDNAG